MKTSALTKLKYNNDNDNNNKTTYQFVACFARMLKPRSTLRAQKVFQKPKTVLLVLKGGWWHQWRDGSAHQKVPFPRRRKAQQVTWCSNLFHISLQQRPRDLEAFSLQCDSIKRACMSHSWVSLLLESMTNLWMNSDSRLAVRAASESGLLGSYFVWDR